MSLPRRVTVEFGGTVLDFYRARLEQSTSDWYRERRLSKMPEDLRAYQHLIEKTKPEFIIELGSYSGASALWFADQLDTFCGGGQVITVDRNPVDIEDHRIVILTGDLGDESIIRSVYDLAARKRVLISEDSAHTYETTKTALERYTDLIDMGGWFVVEDTIVDQPKLNVWGQGAGVVGAIDEFLSSRQGQRFHRREFNPYGISSNPGGYLEAVR